MVMLLTIAMTGCATEPKTPVIPGDRQGALTQANKFYASHEYYNARSSLKQILDKNPQDPDASKLMADILDKEIERQKEHLLPQAAEEMGADEKRTEVKTWMERSRALFQAKQYDLALFAAEKVFLYDNENSDASELIDQIRAKALKEGKADTLFIHKMYKEEIADRLQQYRQQAEDFVARGQFGQARFVVEKILLLEPEDPQALALYQKILVQEEKMGGLSQ